MAVTRSLFIVAGAPYPPCSGAPMRSWQNINVLATRGPVHVLSVGGREPGEYTMPLVAEWVHIDNADFPAKPGLRSLLARLFNPRQYSVPDVFATSAINERLRDMIDRIKPDVIVLSHWKNGCPDPLKGRPNVVLDMHNIESLLGSGVKHHVRSPFLRAFLSWRWRSRERGLVRNASRAWVCGANDAAALKKLGRRLPAPIIWPNAVDLSYYEGVRTGRIALPSGLHRNGATVVYIGLYSYYPNRIAAMELIEKIAPLVLAQVPRARFIFVGAEPTDGMLDAARKDSRILVTGHVADVRRYLALADMCIVPLRAGGGTRLKILECFAASVPVVSTCKGVEGIEVTPGREIRIAETPEALADNAVQLLGDEEARHRQTAAAYDLVRASYSWESLPERLDAALPITSEKP